MKKRSTAILLALFLGAIGIHRFYLNRNVSGLIYLLFCWTFIPALIAFLEAISYLTYTDEAFNEKYFPNQHLSNKIDAMTQTSATDDLVKLASLFEKNLITKDEFESKKQILLGKV